jgi:hypothetical protein
MLKGNAHMRKLLATIVLVGGLSGCATTSTIPRIDVEEVRLIAVQVCGFLPLVESVAEIIAAGNPALATGSAVANAICAAVTRASAIRGVIPVVNGVPVKGRFVARK